MIDRFGARVAGEGAQDETAGAPAPAHAGHTVLVGHGRVGKLVSAGLIEAGQRLVIVETQPDKDDLPDAEGLRVETGNAAQAEVLRRAAIADARLLIVAVPDAFEAGQIVQQARTLNPKLRIVARAQQDAGVDHLVGLGADLAIMGEREIARRMVDQAVAHG
jgi:CPA2 family monovalent cation:H+ antiporter-2